MSFGSNPPPDPFAALIYSKEWVQLLRADLEWKANQLKSRVIAPATALRIGYPSGYPFPINQPPAGK
jgi:hypothetical protein